MYTVNSCFPRRRNQSTFLLQGRGGVGVTFLSLPISSSLSLPTRKKNDLTGDIGERLTSVGSHYLGEKSNTFKRQCLPIILGISIC